jgi:hypothetical protein
MAGLRQRQSLRGRGRRDGRGRRGLEWCWCCGQTAARLAATAAGPRALRVIAVIGSAVDWSKETTGLDRLCLSKEEDKDAPGREDESLAHDGRSRLERGMP